MPLELGYELDLFEEPRFTYALFALDEEGLPLARFGKPHEVLDGIHQGFPSHEGRRQDKAFSRLLKASRRLYVEFVHDHLHHLKGRIGPEGG